MRSIGFRTSLLLSNLSGILNTYSYYRKHIESFFNIDSSNYKFALIAVLDSLSSTCVVSRDTLIFTQMLYTEVQSQSFLYNIA